MVDEKELKLGSGIDFIGDVHGHCRALEALLLKLDYKKSFGVWRHPNRLAVFVGDLIDRGPDQIDTVDLVRAMVDEGAARCIMGNHEFNAVAFHSFDAGRGTYFRARNEQNRHQHRAFLDVVELDSELHRDIIGWIKALPLWIETSDFRVVHACWRDQERETLGAYCDTEGHVKPSFWQYLMTKGCTAYDAVETMLKGLEVPLPEGYTFRDPDGIVRRSTRVRWWDGRARTYAQAAIVEEGLRDVFPDTQLPSSALVDLTSGPMTFFGHYWLTGEPRPVAERHVCVDFSIAKEGVLAAYRFDGEAKANSSKFVWVR